MVNFDHFHLPSSVLMLSLASERQLLSNTHAPILMSFFLNDDSLRLIRVACMSMSWGVIS